MGIHETLGKSVTATTLNPTLARRKTGQSERQPILVPISGIREAGSSEYLSMLVPGTPVVVEMDGDRLRVRHQNSRLGWLEGRYAPLIKHALQRGRVLRCEIRSRGGSDNEPNPVVAVWL